MVDVEAGRLLVATPATEDPNFRRSVVLVVEHQAAGSLGVVLNRPTDVAVADTLPQWSDAMSPPAVLFSGGPVEPEVLICVGRRRGHDDAGFDGWLPFWGRIGTVNLERDPALVEERLESMRVFAGFAGWGPGQLDREIEAGGWFVLAATAEDPFAVDAEDLWHDVLERQPGSLAWVADFPADPSMN